MRQPLFLRINHFPRVEDVFRVHGPLDGLHDFQFAFWRELFHIFQFLGTDAVFTGQAAADAVGIGVDLLVEFFDVLFPFFVAHIHLAEDDVQVAVADMGVDLDFKGIVLADVHDFFNGPGDFMYRNDDVVREEDLALEFDGRLAVTAHIPDAVVSFQDFGSARFFTDRADSVHLGVQFVFVERFDGDDDVNAVVVVRHVLVMAVVSAAADVGIVHVFDAGRVDAGFHQLRHHVQCLARVRVDGQDVEAVRRQGDELDCDFGDDAQRPFTADDELFQIVAGRAFLEDAAAFDDIPCRRDDFQAVDLVAGDAIADGAQAAGIGGQVAADEAAFGAGRVAGIHETDFFGGVLQVYRADTGFDGHVHAFFIQFDDLVETVHAEDQAAADRDGTVGQAGAAAADGNGEVVFIGQFDDVRDFLGIGRRYGCFREMEYGRIGFIVCLIL